MQHVPSWSPVFLEVLSSNLVMHSCAFLNIWVLITSKFSSIRWKSSFFERGVGREKENERVNIRLVHHLNVTSSYNRMLWKFCLLDFELYKNYSIVLQNEMFLYSFAWSLVCTINKFCYNLLHSWDNYQ